MYVGLRFLLVEFKKVSLILADDRSSISSFDSLSVSNRFVKVFWCICIYIISFQFLHWRAINYLKKEHCSHIIIQTRPGVPRNTLTFFNHQQKLNHAINLTLTWKLLLYHHAFNQLSIFEILWNLYISIIAVQLTICKAVLRLDWIKIKYLGNENYLPQNMNISMNIRVVFYEPCCIW